MKITTVTNLRDFSFWAGATDTVKYLSPEQLDTIEDILCDIYPNGVDDTTLNDLFWFDDDIIAQWLGYDSFEGLTPPWD